MKWKWLTTTAAFVLIAAPASGATHRVSGTVLAAHPRAGTIVLAQPNGLGLTIHSHARVALGDRIQLVGAQLQVLSRVRTALVRGVVLRRLPRMTFIATGGSVLTLHHAATRRVASASDHGGNQGAIGEFRVRFDGEGLAEDDFVPAAPAGTAGIEGVVQSLSPFVVSVEGLPITVTVPTGVTLPTTLAAGQRVELIVQAGAANSFTLVSIGQNENENQEIEAQGVVSGSTAAQLSIDSDGTTLTFNAPSGTTLPILAAGTQVEVRGVTVNGVLTLDRLKVENDNEGDDGDGGH